jgi:hypothetical protein
MTRCQVERPARRPVGTNDPARRELADEYEALATREAD